MATLGNTSKPTSTIEAWSGGTYEIMAIALTLPAGGPWRITDVGVWAAGYNSVSCDARVCLWSAAGSLLRSSSTFTLVGQAFANGNVSSYQRALTSHYDVAGGTTVYVGLQVEPNAGYQFGRYSSGSHYDAKDAGAFPSSFGSGGSHSPAGSAWLIYESANTAPNAPTSLSPTGNAIVNSGTAPTVSGTRSDPDSGDYITAYEIEAYRDNGTTKVYDSGKISVGGTPTTFSRQISLPNSHEYFKWKARTWDKEDVAGPFSALQRFKANTVPSTPGAPTISSTSTLTPNIAGSFSDSGDTLAAVQIEVQENDGSPTMWTSGDIAKSGTSWSQAYGGSALSWGVAYRARYRVKDSHGAYSSWSAYKTWTPVQPAGPDNMSPTGTNPRQSSLTPTLTVGHLAAQFRNDEMQVRTADNGGGTLIWNKTWDGSDYGNTNSHGNVYAGTALAYGGTYYWRARVELTTGVITEWSDWYPFRINATPNAPTGMTPTGGVATTDTTPLLHMDFSDADLDQGDFADLVDVEVRDNADDSLDWSQTAVAPSDPEGLFHEVSTGALTYEKTYKWRARFTDDMGRQGPWSSYQLFKVSEPPVASLVGPADASVVTESTPTLEWGYSSPGGKTRYSYRIRVFDVGPVSANYADEVLVWDSGETVSTATARDVPYGVLVNDHDYRWEVEVKDTDGLTDTL